MRKFSILGFVFLLAGCAGLKPDYAKPAADLPAGWRDAPADGVQVRNSLHNLGQQYGVPVWLTEVSHGNVGGHQPVQGDTFDALRARAIDIHDNLVYADMSGFIFQGAYWDTELQRNHFGTDLTLAQLQAEDGDAFVVLGDPTANQWQLTMGAYSLGHYSRWVRPGDVRVDANSDDSLVQVTAFRDGAGGTDSFVLINNSNEAQEVTLSLSGATFQGSLSGEQQILSIAGADQLTEVARSPRVRVGLAPKAVDEIAQRLVAFA